MTTYHKMRLCVISNRSHNVTALRCMHLCSVSYKDGLDLLTHKALYELDEANDTDNVTNHSCDLRFSVHLFQYAAPAWSGTCSAADRTRLDSLLRRSKRLGYCSDDVPVVADLFNTADDDFFHRVKTNSDHVYQPYLPDPTNIPYQPRNLSHNITLINKTKFLNDTDFIIRMLYKYSY